MNGFAAPTAAKHPTGRLGKSRIGWRGATPGPLRRRTIARTTNDAQVIRGRRLLRLAWHLARDTVAGFIVDDALSRGAAISYYTIFSLAPVLLIAIAVAGLFFGYQAAQGAIVGQLSGLMGQDSATALQNLLQGARYRGGGLLATGIGVVTLAITATGVFTELQTSLNLIWKAEPPRSITMAIGTGTVAVAWADCRARFLAAGVPGCQRNLASSRSLAERSRERASRGRPSNQRTDFACSGYRAIRRHLQGFTRPGYRLGRCDDRGGGHGAAVRRRKIPDWALYRQQCNRQQLRVGRVAAGSAVVDLLFRADIPAGSRVHQDVCRTSAWWAPAIGATGRTRDPPRLRRTICHARPVYHTRSETHGAACGYTEAISAAGVSCAG